MNAARLASIRNLGFFGSGLVLHVGLLLLPAVVSGLDLAKLLRLDFALFLACVSMFCAGDLTSLWYAADVPTARLGNEDRRARRLALATGLLLLAIFWIAIAQRMLLSIPPNVEGMVVGGGLMLAGGCLRFCAVVTLGR